MNKKICALSLGLLVCGLSWGQTNDVATFRQTNDSLNRTEFSINQIHNKNKEVTKAQGDSAYMQNDYATAIQIYEQLLENGEAAEVYYNLGNSYYKTDNIAHAILNYERALILQPDNADIRANLDIARSKTIDKVTPIPEVFFITWIHTLSNSMSSDKWAKTSIACFLLFLILLGVFLLGKRTSFKKTGFIGAIFMLFVCVVSNVFSAQQKQSRLERNQAIVLTPSITVRSTPSESGTSLFVIHEGHKVEIKDNSMHEWKEIELEDGKVGWIPASSIEII